MDNNQEQQKQEEGKLPADMLAAEKPTEVSTQATEEDRPSETEQELPEGVSERTRQEFEKLKARNAELAKKLAEKDGKAQQKKSVLDMFAPQADVQNLPNNQEAGQPTEDLSKIEEIKPDENGYVDLSQINRTISEINKRTKLIEQETKKAKETASNAVLKVSEYEHTATTKQVYNAHPELDPNSESFDETFSEFVRNELIGQMVSGQKQDYMAAANKIKEKFYNPNKSKQDDKKKENVQKAELINSVPSSKQGNMPKDDSYLYDGTRKGDQYAIGERLKRSGF